LLAKVQGNVVKDGGTPLKQWIKPQLISISSVGLEDLRLPRSGQDLGQSGSARSTGTASKSCERTFWPTPRVSDIVAGRTLDEKGNRVSNGVRYGANLADKVKFTPTSSTSTEPNSEASISSQVDFLASLSALPGTEEARQMTVRSGRKCSGLLTKRDPLGWLARTFLGSCRWNSTTCFLTWKESATPRGRLLFRLVPSMPSTGGTDFGSLPETFYTPQEDDASNVTPNPNRRLGLYAQVFPTPNTPRPHDNDNTAGMDYPSQNQFDLARAVGTTKESGALNPAWVEWLMGYPSGWTDLKD